ncbi:MAG: FadR/GntR family transcriptional regulator [Thermoleophilia bacterium]
MAEFVRKRKARLYESIVERIEALIREKTLAPGDQLLPERRLAEQLGVSRAAVREALTALAARGLIEITPGGGAYVREARIESLIDPLASVMLKERENVFDLLEARRIVEVGVARLAAERARETDLALIQAAAVEMRDCIREGQAADEADVAFHLLIAEATHNPVLSSLMTMLSGLMREAYGPSRRRLLDDPERCEIFVREHMELYEALRDHDPERAGCLMEEHLAVATEALRRLNG